MNKDSNSKDSDKSQVTSNFNDSNELQVTSNELKTNDKDLSPSSEPLLVTRNLLLVPDEVARHSSPSFCVRCGNCKSVCPTYAEDATEGMSARGRIMLLKKLAEGEIEPSKVLDERIFSCILCGACNSICPLGIGITDAIYQYRRDLKGFNRKRMFFGLGMSVALKSAPAGFRILKFIEGIREVVPVHRFQPFRALRELGIESLEAPLRDGESLFKVARPKGRIAIFTGCSVNFLYQGIGRSLIRTLKKLNYEVVLPKGEVCCGAPLMGLGFEEDAAELAERNMKTFKRMNVEAVIGLCPTCINFIRNEYRRLIGDGIENAQEVSQFFIDKLPATSNSKDSNESQVTSNYKDSNGSQVTSNKLKTKDSKNSSLVTRYSSLPSDSSLKVIYHDPCHSVHGLKVKAEPRRILKSMGLDLIDAEGGCCGFGGAFRLLYQDLSQSILRKRIEEYRKADVIVTSCPNCMIQFRSRIKDRKIKHIVELIEEAVQGERDEKER